MFAWLRRALSAQSKAPVARPTVPSKKDEAPPPPALDFDWSSLSSQPAAPPPPADPFPELSDWTGAIFDQSASLWDSISAFPPIATKIFSLLEHPDFKLQELVNLIHQDPTISAEVLRAANSAAFSRGVTSLDIRDAVQRLGAREVASIAVASSTRSLFDMETRVAHEQFAARARGLWHHSMTCAFTSGWLAMGFGRGQLDRAFLGGMLHDIGKTVGLRALASLMISGALPTPISDARIERLLDAVRPRLGGEAIERWALPEFFRALATAPHGAPPEVLRDDRNFHIVRVVSAMNLIRTGAATPADFEDARLAAAALALTPQSISTLSTSLKSYAERADQLSTQNNA